MCPKGIERSSRGALKGKEPLLRALSGVPHVRSRARPCRAGSRASPRMRDSYPRSTTRLGRGLWPLHPHRTEGMVNGWSTGGLRIDPRRETEDSRRMRGWDKRGTGTAMRDARARLQSSRGIGIKRGSEAMAEADGNRTRRRAAEPRAGEIRLGPRAGTPPPFLAEADGNRTRRPGIARPTGFEDRGGHQPPFASRNPA
jgi:hypothetical protein